MGAIMGARACHCRRVPMALDRVTHGETWGP